MKLENVAYVGEQVADIVERTKELPAKIKEGVDVAYKGVAKGYRRTKAAAEEAVEDTRRNIKEKPLASVGIAAAAGVGVGLLTGWLLARKRR